MLAADEKGFSAASYDGINEDAARGLILLNGTALEQRRKMFRALFDHMRQKLAIAVDALD